jgi:hypothetical protein
MLLIPGLYQCPAAQILPACKRKATSSDWGVSREAKAPGLSLEFEVCGGEVREALPECGSLGP